MSTLLEKIKSALLCMSAHPDNEQGSEFEDRIEDLIEIESFLKTIPQWVKIESEEDLPKEFGEYWIIDRSNNKMYRREFNKSTKNFFFEYSTHYQRIIKPDLPVY
jgi:hypothetical protein